MHLFLMWADHKAEAAWSDATRVAAKFQGVFAPLLEVPLSQRIFVGPGTQTVTLELPARGWRPPFVHEGEEQRGAGWVLAADYPVNAASVLGAYGEHGAVLPALCRRLERAPVPLLKELAPPFCLLWSSPGTGETIVQHDGLGMSQLFVYDDGRRWAMSNKLMAFKALGLPIVPVAEEWAVRCTLGWFPRDTTGYRNIKFVGPGVQLRLSGVGVSEVRHDVLGDWCKPPRMSPEGAAELANYSVMEFVRGCLPLWDKPEAGLTGGWDSRAIVACLRACGAEFTAAVRGSPERHDVVIANDLARVAGIPLRVHGGGGLPPADAAECGGGATDLRTADATSARLRAPSGKN